VRGEFGVKERKFCMELGGPAALEVRDRYGEPIVMLGGVSLWLGKDSGSYLRRLRFLKQIARSGTAGAIQEFTLSIAGNPGDLAYVG
jgi:hypothetical protein